MQSWKCKLEWLLKTYQNKMKLLMYKRVNFDVQVIMNSCLSNDMKMWNYRQCHIDKEKICL